MNIPSVDSLRAYSAPLSQPGPRAELAARSGLSLDWASLYLDAISNEAETALRLFKLAGMSRTDRILEVGAGAGLFTGFLQSRGLNVVAIEPTGDGFEATSKLTQIVREATGVAANILPLAAREINPIQHGHFDLIFSVNVIEHFQPLKENLDALAPVMNTTGVQIHTSPNYRVPYEPHYRIPLLPYAPHLTPFIGYRRSETLWRSLNFISASDLRSYARRFGLILSFQRGALSDSLQRLCAEPAFAARHPKIFNRSARLMKTIGLISMLKSLPPDWVTPMTAILRRH